MDYKKTAAEIIKYVGGEENVSGLEHCSTRLRFTLIDKSKVNAAALQATDGVLKVISNVQVQVVIGNEVVEVYNEILKICNVKAGGKVADNKGEKKSVGAIILEYLVGIFQPLIPAIAGAGILKSILVLLSTLGVMSKASGTYVVLMAISDATFYFLPIMVAVTTTTKLNTNKLVAVAAVGVLLLPSVNNAIASEAGLKFLGFALKKVQYNSQVFPAILCTLFLGFLEKKLTKVTPKAIRTFFVPMVALAITVPVTLMFLGPLGLVIGTGLATCIMWLYAKLGFVAVAIVAGILPLMVSTGMHKAMIPYVVSSLGTLGYEILYNAASLAHNISESGACFAVAIRTKNEVTKAAALSAGISALMGITEPALYGITLQNKNVLKSVMVSAAAVGAFLGLVGLKAFVAVGPGLASITMFVDPNNSMNFIYAVIGLVASLCLSFVLTLIFYKED